MKTLLLLALIIFISGCGAPLVYKLHHASGPEVFCSNAEIGQTTRSEVLKQCGPPQVYDTTKSGDVGDNYLVYEKRLADTFGINLLGLGCWMKNKEKSTTYAFYFDNEGILKATGISKNEPTGDREAYGFLVGIMPFDIVK